MDFLSLISDFEAEDWSWIVRGLLILFPTVFSFKYYKDYRIQEYLIFGIFWLIAAIGSLLYPFILAVDNLWLWQIQEASIVWFFFLLAVHSARLRWSGDTLAFKFLIYSGLFLALFLQSIILTWEPFVQEKGKELFWDVNVNPIYKGSGAGLMSSSGLIIYSTGHTIIRDIFALYSSFIFFYAYWTVKPVNPNKRIIRAHKLWKIAVSLTFINFAILTWIWRINDIAFYIGGITALISLIIIAGITMFYPEAFLLSQTQINRILHLYHVAEKMHPPDQPQISSEDPLMDYLGEIASNKKRGNR